MKIIENNLQDREGEALKLHFCNGYVHVEIIQICFVVFFVSFHELIFTSYFFPLNTV